jgi:hypothetical protein
MSKEAVKRGIPGRDQFINAILADRKLGGMAVRVGARLGMYLNCTHGQCDPGYPTIANALGVSERSVIRAVAELEARGWIEVDRADGKMNNKFRLFMIDPNSVNRVTAVVTPDADDHDPDGVTEIRKSGDKNALKNVNRVTTAVTQNTEKENTEYNNEKWAASPPTLSMLREADVTDDRERAFAALRAVYPNKTKHHDSRVVLDELIDEGFLADDVITEAKRYAAKCTGTKPKDVPYLCYWLKVDARPALEAASYLQGAAHARDDAGLAPMSYYEAAYGGDTQ